MFLLNIRFVILILMSGMLVYFSLLVWSRIELDVPMNAKSFRRFFRFWNTWTRKSMQGNTVTQTQIWNSNITKWKNMVEYQSVCVCHIFLFVFCSVSLLRMWIFLSFPFLLHTFFSILTLRLFRDILANKTNLEFKCNTLFVLRSPWQTVPIL